MRYPRFFLLLIATALAFIVPTLAAQNQKEELVPKIVVGDYKFKAEIAFAEYLLALQERNWTKMVKFTELTWRYDSKDPANDLKVQYEFKKLLGAKITKRDIISSAAEKITATIFYTSIDDKKVIVKSITAMVICETGSYKPDSSGVWGVNPISTMRED